MRSGTPFRGYLRDAAREDREAALALAREVFAEGPRLRALGFPLPETWEAFLARVGLEPEGGGGFSTARCRGISPRP